MPTYLIGGFDPISNKLVISKDFTAGTEALARALAITDTDFLALGINSASYCRTIQEATTTWNASLGTSLDSSSQSILTSVNNIVTNLVTNSSVASNSSTTPLTGSGSFPGVYVSVDNYEGLRVSVRTDQNSATDGLQIQWSEDGTNEILFARDSFTVTASNDFVTSIPVKAKYFRVVYTNGVIAQTAFDLRSTKLARLESSAGTGSTAMLVQIDQSTPGTTNNVNVSNSLTVGTLPAITGTVTANAGANLNTSSLALETGGNLASIISTLTNLAYAMNDAFSKAMAIAGQLDDTAPVVATEGNIAPLRITPYRAKHTNLRNNSGSEIGISNSPIIIEANKGEFSFGNDNRLRVGQETSLILDPIKAGALNTNLWLSSTSTMTVTQSPGMLILNAGLSTAANAYAILSSIKKPLQLLIFPLIIHTRAQFKPQNNSVIEIGFGTVATNAPPTDGVFLRIDSAGILKGVINNNGTESLTSALPALDSTKFYDCEIIVFHNKVQFIIRLASGTLVTDTSVTLPDTMSSPTSGGTLSVFQRVYNTAIAPTTAPQLIVAIIAVNQLDLNTNKSWTLQRIENAKGSYQNTLSPFAQTANWTNSTAPASATLSNTVAGYTTLGGLYQFAAVAGLATDYVLFGYQVPAGLQLIITGIDISCIITGADIAGSSTVLQWGLGLNSSAVALNTAEAPPTTYAPRRIGLGIMGFLQTDNRGIHKDISRQFPSPLVVDGGRFLQVILTVPVGTATLLQIFRGTVNINGFFE